MRSAPSQQLQVGGDEVAGAHAHHVAGDELARRHGLPAPVAQDSRRHARACCAAPSRLKTLAVPGRSQGSRSRPAARAATHSVGELVHEERKDRDELDHPRRDPPELLRETKQRGGSASPGPRSDLGRASVWQRLPWRGRSPGRMRRSSASLQQSSQVQAASPCRVARCSVRVACYAPLRWSACSWVQQDLRRYRAAHR